MFTLRGTVAATNRVLAAVPHSAVQCATKEPLRQPPKRLWWMDWLSDAKSYRSGRGQAVGMLRADQTSAVEGSLKVEAIVTDRRVLDHYPSMQLPSHENVLIRSSYMSSVSHRNKIPNWVAEKVTLESLDGAVSRRDSRFAADTDVPIKWRSSNNDFWDSGYSRGHMAAAGLHKNSQLHNQHTFYLSGNILPQELSNNGCDWLRLENLCRRLARSCEHVYVISGPMWLPSDTTRVELKNFGNKASASHERSRKVAYDVIGDHTVAAPTHLWKVIVAAPGCGVELGEDRTFEDYEKPLEMKNASKVMLGAFIMPNYPENKYLGLESFEVPLDCVEFHSGLDFKGVVDFCKEVSGLPADKEEGQEFLKSISLCDDGTGRCADLHSKQDKRIAAYRQYGRLELCRTMAEVDRVMNRAEKIGVQGDFWVKRGRERASARIMGVNPKQFGTDKKAQVVKTENLTSSAKAA